MAFASILALGWPCQGPRWAPVWVKSGPSLAKGSTKTTAFGEKGNLAKTMLFTRFSYCLGGPWQAFNSSRGPVEALQEAEDALVPAYGHKGSLGIYGNGRKRSQTDATGRELSQTRAGSEVKVYLKAKTYDQICSIYLLSLIHI